MKTEEERRFHIPPEALGHGYQNYDVPPYLVKKPQPDKPEARPRSFLIALLVFLALLGGFFLAVHASFKPEPFIKTSPAPIVYP